MKRNTPAAVNAAAFIITFDTVGPDPAFVKGQVVPREALEKLGLERLLELGAIAPAEAVPEEPEQPGVIVVDLARVTVPELAVELAGRGFVLVDAEEQALTVEELARMKELLPQVEARLQQQVEEARQAQEELTEALRGYSEHNKHLEVSLAAANAEGEALKARIRELEAKPEEPVTPDPEPAHSPAKKGK